METFFFFLELPSHLCFFFIIFWSIHLVRHILKGVLHIGDNCLHCLQFFGCGIHFRVLGHYMPIVWRLHMNLRGCSILIYKTLKVALEKAIISMYVKVSINKIYQEKAK